MPRQVILDTRGTLYYVIIRGLEKRQIVDDEPDQREFVFTARKIGRRLWGHN